MNWVAESVSLVAHLLLVLSYWQKKSRNIFLIQTISYFVFIGYFFVLGSNGMVSAFTFGVMIVRHITLFIYKARDEKAPLFFMWIFMAASAAIMFIFMESIFDLIPGITAIVFTYFCFCGNEFSIKLYGGIIMCVAWVGFYLPIQAYIGIAFQGCIAISTTFALIYGHYKGKKEKDAEDIRKILKKQKEKHISKDLLDSATKD